MGCLPESGGCERRRIDPFVSHLNGIEGLSYSYGSCLDREIRDRPQPEILYIDHCRSQRLVVERKTVVWPPSFAERHRAEHRLADIIIEELRDVTCKAPYALELPGGLPWNNGLVMKFAQKVVLEIRSQIDKLTVGGTLCGHVDGRRWWFVRQNEQERDLGEPATDLVIYFESNPNSHLLVQNSLPKQLTDHIEKQLLSTSSKFCEYVKDRRILLLDPRGNLRFLDVVWWRQALSYMRATGEVPEIWLAIYDWITDFEEGWNFERVR